MRTWTCDYEGCDEFAQWYRKLKKDLLKLCTKHEAEFARKHWGKDIHASELDDDDIRYLERKEEKKEYRKAHPFEVRLFSAENGTRKIKIRDSETGERRSFILKETDLGKFDEIYKDLEREGFSPKPSIDEYVKRLRNGVNKKGNACMHKDGF